MFVDDTEQDVCDTKNSGDYTADPVYDTEKCGDDIKASVWNTEQPVCDTKNCGISTEAYITVALNHQLSQLSNDSLLDELVIV
ncbi:hypothetical protein [Marinifilum fragile]|uniref:hypothetical protein n=1 Tax=Marinifilum fragile TaxID=570161 RepID=UPI0012FABC46|nr:hypothetical protein [Marinifilum fragile]